MNPRPRPSRTRPVLLNRRQFVSGALATASAAAVSRPGLAGASADGRPAVPPVDPGYVGPHYFGEEERRALLEVMDQGSPFRFWGPGRPMQVRQFEEGFSRRMGTRFALGVTSGTAALDCAMAAIEVGPGDEVIVPAYTWWSDYTCVVQAGATPVFVDINDTLNLDPADLERRITPRTKAVIAVHLLGGPADLDQVLAVARRHQLKVVEDCAQCVGGSYQGRPLGSLGDIGIYSFQINKTMTSGEGGAVVTSDPVLYERAVRFHDVGIYRSLFADRTGAPRLPVFAGENFRMNELTGAVLNGQLPKLDRMVQDLQRHARRVLEELRGLPDIQLRRQPDPAGDIGYAVFLRAPTRDTRDRWIKLLRERGVPASTLTGSVLLPVEESVMAKRARHPNWPSWASAAGQALVYGADTCRQTLEVHDHFVQVRIGPHYTDRIDDFLIRSLREVVTG